LNLPAWLGGAVFRAGGTGAESLIPAEHDPSCS
jgi:hypothetical protein